MTLSIELAFVIDTGISFDDSIFQVRNDIADALFTALGDDEIDNDVRVSIVGVNDQASPTSFVLQPFSDEGTSLDRIEAANETLANVFPGGGGSETKAWLAGMLTALDGTAGDWSAEADIRQLFVISDRPAGDLELLDQVAALTADVVPGDDMVSPVTVELIQFGVDPNADDSFAAVAETLGLGPLPAVINPAEEVAAAIAAVPTDGAPVPDGVVTGTEAADDISDVSGYVDPDGDFVDRAVVPDDVIEGLGGNDVIRAGLGDDLVFGGDGADTIFGDDGDDVLRGERGDDLVRGGDGDDRINLGSGDDIGRGNDGDDRISGNSGDDILIGEAGDDALRGGKGADFLNGGSGDDMLRGESGDDRLVGGGGVDMLDGGAGDDELNDGGGDDMIFGRSGADFINNRSGDDVINAGVGDDTVFVGAGNDDVTLGEGADFLRFSTSQDGANVVRDFSLGEDTLALRVEDAEVLTILGGQGDGDDTLITSSANAEWSVLIEDAEDLEEEDILLL